VGKSDSFVFPWYRRNVKVPAGSRVLFLGQTHHNAFTAALEAESEFRDIELGNWDINGDLQSDSKYDAVVCTRCAYFSESPQRFVDQCMRVLRDGGSLYADWGLGDHWRFPRFRVGWMSNGEREYAQYGGERQYLHSAAWKDSLENHPAVLDFKQNIRRHGYEERLLRPVIQEEVDSVLEIPPNAEVSCLSLWPDSPQLYVLLRITR